MSWVPYLLPRLQWGNENEDSLMIIFRNWYDIDFGDKIEATQTFSSVKSIKNEILGDTVFKIFLFMRTIICCVGTLSK